VWQGIERAGGFGRVGRPSGDSTNKLWGQCPHNRQPQKIIKTGILVDSITGRTLPRKMARVMNFMVWLTGFNSGGRMTCMNAF